MQNSIILGICSNIPNVWKLIAANGKKKIDFIISAKYFAANMVDILIFLQNILPTEKKHKKNSVVTKPDPTTGNQQSQ